MPEQVLKEAKKKMNQTLENLHHDFASVRSSRANPKMLDKVTVDYYGVMTPIDQLATISVPEGNQLYIKPYDKSMVGPVEKAIFAANLGITPVNDGEGIRLNFPKMTEETRKETVKEIHKLAEDAKVAIRNIRRDANTHFKKMEKKSEITEDDLHYYEDKIQELTDDHTDKIDTIYEEKKEEIMKI